MKSFAELIENNEKLYPTFRDIYGKRGENK